MKKIFIIFFIISVLILTSCEKTKELISDIDNINNGIYPVISETIDLITAESTAEDNIQIDKIEVTQDCTELSHIDLSFLIELDWTEENENTNKIEIEFKVFPLTDYSKGIYSNSLTGDLIFIDEKINPVKLPFQPVAWNYIYDFDPINQISKPIGYALQEKLTYWDETILEYIREDYILMLADGTIPLDSDGEYIKLIWGQFEGPVYFINNGSAVVIHKNKKYGIYDLIKQKIILPCEYDSICPVDSIFYVVSDGYGFLYDKNGNKLYSLGKLTEEQLQNKEPFCAYDICEFNCNTVNGWSAGAEYYLNGTEQLFYKISDNASGIDKGYVNGSLSSWGKYIVYSTSDMKRVYVTERNGSVLYSGECYNYGVSGEYLALYTTSGFVIVNNKDFTERKFPADLNPNDSYASGSVFYKFDNDLVYYMKEFWDKELYSVDESGNVLKVKEYDKPVLYVKNDDFEPVYVKNDNYYLQDEDENILLISSYKEKNENVLYGMLEVHGNFVFLNVPDGGESAYTNAVYSRDGKLLAGNIYGVASSPAPGGGIFVYISPDNCIVLYPDGSTIPVPAAPAVERLLWNQFRH